MIGVLLSFDKKLNRELGANPKQTRCCKFRYSLQIKLNPLSPQMRWEGHLQMEQVRRPANIYNF